MNYFSSRGKLSRNLPWKEGGLQGTLHTQNDLFLSKIFVGRRGSSQGLFFNRNMACQAIKASSSLSLAFMVVGQLLFHDGYESEAVIQASPSSSFTLAKSQVSLISHSATGRRESLETC